MITRELDNDSAGKYGWFAQQDAIRRSENNRSKYSQADQRRVVTARDLLDNAYAYDAIFINYRQTFVAIKLDGARVKNRAMLNEVESIFEDRNVEKTVTKQGVIYRFFKS